MDGDGILVHATIPVDADPGEDHDFVIVDLPDIEQAATISHRGAKDDVMPTIQARWRAGSTRTGTARPAATANCTSSSARTEIIGW